MVLNHKNIKLSNKDKILEVINEKSNFPMVEDLMKHNLVENGISTYNYDLGTIEVFEPIIEVFKKFSGNKFEVTDFWFNKYKKNGFVKPHNHQPVGSNIKWLSGVYYFSKKENSGNIVINDKELNIIEDDFILFDAEDVHYSKPNNEDSQRIVFSINLREKNNDRN